MTTRQSPTTLDEPMTGTEDQETQPQHPLEEAGREATQRAGHMAERAADIGLQQADRGRDKAATGIDEVAKTIRRISTEMQPKQPQVADVGLTAAEGAERVARYLRENDTRQILSTVEDAARRTPLLFIGGAFVLGLAASRFIKAAAGEARDAIPAYRSRTGTNFRSSPESYEATGPGRHNGNEGL
jgi:hypothetical protein